MKVLPDAFEFGFGVGMGGMLCVLIVEWIRAKRRPKEPECIETPTPEVETTPPDVQQS